MKNETIRESLIQQAEAAFIVLMEQNDALFDLTSFYIDRYPCISTSDVMKTEELMHTINNLASLSTQLSEIIARWKIGESRVLSRTGTEVSVLNELWVNVQALLYFLASHEISLDGFDDQVALGAFRILVKCNRLLT